MPWDTERWSVMVSYSRHVTSTRSLSRDNAWLRAILGVLALLVGTADLSSAASGDKVTLCHFTPKDPENSVTICVGQNALAAHLAHGDSLTSCGYDNGCPGLEMVPLYSDDLQNGTFDFFVPEGSGSYSVLDDGGGDLVAGLVGDVELKFHKTATSSRTWENFKLSVQVKTSGTGAFSVAFRWNESTGRGYWLDNVLGVWTLRRVTPGGTTTLVTASEPTPVDTWYKLSISVVTIGAKAWVQAHVDSAPLFTTVDPAPVPFGGVRFGATGAGFQVWLDDLEIKGHVPYALTWNRTGGPEGGWLTDIEVDPLDWRVAYVAGYDGGVFKTTDGGVTWNELGIPNGLWKVRVRTIELAPSNADVVYVGVQNYNVSSLWRSDDGGKMWKWTEAGDIVAAAPDGDEYGDDTMAIGIDRTDPMHIFAGITSQGVYAAGFNGLYKSTDGAETWTFLLPGGNPSYMALAVDPMDPDIVYLGGESGLSPAVLKSTDGGSTWKDIGADIDYHAVNALVIDPNDSSTIYAGTGHNPQGGPLGKGLYKSTNGGNKWSKLGGLTGIPDVGVPAVAIDRSDSLHIAVATMGFGVYVSEDGGAFFEQRNYGIDPDTEGMVYALAMDPTDGDIMYAGTNTHYGRKPLKHAKTAIYKTVDGGLNWTELLKGDGSHPVYPFIGLAGGIEVIAVHPLEPEKIFVGAHAPGILFSENGGNDWRYANQGFVPPLTHVYPYRMEISPNGKFLYATSCGRSVFRNRFTAAE